MLGHRAGVDRRHLGAEERRVLGAGDDHPCLGIIDHEGEALGRVRRIERQIGAAGFDGGHDGRDHVEGALQANADQSLCGDAVGAELAGQAVRARVQFRVGKRLLFVGDRDRVRRLRGLRLEDGVEGLAHRERDQRVPLLGHPPRVVLAQQLDRRQARARNSGDGLEHADVVFEHPDDRGAVEEVGVVLH